MLLTNAFSTPWCLLVVKYPLFNAIPPIRPVATIHRASPDFHERTHWCAFPVVPQGKCPRTETLMGEVSIWGYRLLCPLTRVLPGSERECAEELLQLQQLQGLQTGLQSPEWPHLRVPVQWRLL